MRVLITGGAGFIGLHLARSLVAAGHEVTALDLLSAQVHADPGASQRAFPGDVVASDVADCDAWARVPGIDTVVHLAAETGVGQSMYEEDRYHRVNVTGTQMAAEFAALRSIPLLVVSSRAVYGEGRYECPAHGTTFGGPCCGGATPMQSREDDPLRPVSVYGETKALAEAAAREVLGVIGPLTIVRPQNVIGPGQSLHNPYTGVLAAFLAMLREQRRLSIYGDGSQTRDFLHVSDLAEMIRWLVARPPPRGAPLVLNAGTGTRTTLLQLAEMAGDAAPVAWPGVVHLDVHRAGDIDHACANVDRMRGIGAPQPTRTARQAITDFVAWGWNRSGAGALTWEEALGELNQRGLTS